MARSPARVISLAIVMLLTIMVLYRNIGSRPAVPKLFSNPLPTSVEDLVHISPSMQKGDAIMGKLRNETLKADLGRAAWKLFHTTMARFPDQPLEEESAALKSYIYLFTRLYPCGECASHFQKILEKFPPQTSSRSAAAAWGCHVHNEVNKSKRKPIFDCANIGGFYDCGCGDDENEKTPNSVDKVEMSELSKTKLVQDGRDLNLDHFKPVQIATEGPTNGG
jgi:FAD-linked sulfhydryl oxidase